MKVKNLPNYAVIKTGRYVGVAVLEKLGDTVIAWFYRWLDDSPGSLGALVEVEFIEECSSVEDGFVRIEDGEG